MKVPLLTRPDFFSKLYLSDVFSDCPGNSRFGIALIFRGNVTIRENYVKKQDSSLASGQ